MHCWRLPGPLRSVDPVLPDLQGVGPEPVDQFLPQHRLQDLTMVVVSAHITYDSSSSNSSSSNFLCPKSSSSSRAAAVVVAAAAAVVHFLCTKSIQDFYLRGSKRCVFPVKSTWPSRVEWKRVGREGVMGGGGGGVVAKIVIAQTLQKYTN